MKLKLALAATTAMAFMTGMAWAGGNTADIRQNGNSNVGTVTQTNGIDDSTYGRQIGNSNTISVKQGHFIGSGANKVGSAADFATQNGSSNKLVVDQDNTNNERNQVGAGLAALDSNNPGAAGTGFDQVHDRNEAYITQYSNRNIVGQVHQDSNNYDGGPANLLVVVQGSSSGGYANNTINSVTQVRTSWGGANQAHVKQNSSDRIESISQYGDSNNTTVNDGGMLNRIRATSQSGTQNVLSITLGGNHNGTVGTEGSGNHAPLGGFTGTYASSLGLTQGNFSQSGNNNNTNFSVTGSSNLYATSQSGNSNLISAVISGSENEVAIRQDTGLNIAGVLVSGGLNDVAVSQTAGQNNMASVTVASSSNQANAAQVGSANTVTINQ